MKFLGGTLYVVVMLFLSVIIVFPLSILGLPWWLVFVLAVITYFFDIIGSVVQNVAWIAAFVVTVSGPQDWVSIVFYIIFAIVEIPIVLWMVMGFVSLIKKIADK